jgi:UDP-N-acetylglucosamine 1-carboxyvinyltransferase
MAMLIAAMCAEGTSVINNAQQIERGYERIEERLNAMGARITRIPPRTPSPFGEKVPTGG